MSLSKFEVICSLLFIRLLTAGAARREARLGLLVGHALRLGLEPGGAVLQELPDPRLGLLRRLPGLFRCASAALSAAASQIEASFTTSKLDDSCIRPWYTAS